MPRLLPRQPSLEQFKKQAKDLIAAYRRGEPDAQARLSHWFPSHRGSLAGPRLPQDGAGLQPVRAAPLPQDGAPPLRLSHAQLAIAREYGFSSWTRLVAWAERGELPGQPADLVELLGVRGWRVVAAATAALTAAGAAGVAAAVEGLSHPSPRVRRGAAGFLDHHADDTCVPKLAELALHDPVPYVRQVAVHAVLCQRCKPAPLAADVLPLLVRVAREDPSPRVRSSALWGLGEQRRDPRAVEVLAAVLRDETHPDLRRVAHHALKRQSPEYRQEAARRAREASLAGQP